MKYKIRAGQQLKVSCIATERKSLSGKRGNFQFELSKNAKENWRIINNFLFEEFTKRVPEGKEYMYRSTNELLRSFNMPDCDGFVYPSMERGKGYNLAIKPEAADRAIEFLGLAYYYNNSYNNKYDNKKINYKDFHCHQYWATTIEKEKIVYEPVGPCKIEFDKAMKIVEGETEYVNEYGLRY